MREEQFNNLFMTHEGGQMQCRISIPIGDLDVRSLFKQLSDQSQLPPQGRLGKRCRTPWQSLVDLARIAKRSVYRSALAMGFIYLLLQGQRRRAVHGRVEKKVVADKTTWYLDL
jgi:hypothetical protein